MTILSATQPAHLPASLILVGAGKMGGAMLRGWLDLGLTAASVSVIEPHPAADLVALAQDHGVRLQADAAGLSPPEMLVLAIKPQGFAAAAPGLVQLVGPQTLLVSIMAGKSMAALEGALPGALGVVRAMPNTPAAVGRGITGVAASPCVPEAAKLRATALLSAIGQVVWVNSEAEIDAVTAVSGSGPAYVFYLVECLAQAGVAAGLSLEVASRLARATIEGAGELLYREPATDASQLRINVTSPGGTTAAALSVLMAENGLAPLMREAVAKAKQRAQELS